MVKLKQIAIAIFLLIFGKSTTGTEKNSKEELLESESKDSKLEIIKQIKKINDDGSYTIGYEADDGSFKIESRDVLGNIKGTYGYLDDSGQIKRVSYSTSNSSSIFNKPESSVVQRIPKINRTITQESTIPTTQSTPTSTSVIQRIAKIRNTSIKNSEKPNYREIVNVESEVSKGTDRSPHLVYATTEAPRILLHSKPLVRSTIATNIQSQKSEGQLIRPDVTASPTELPLYRRLALKEETKPVIEEPELRGNILRRQLSQERANFDPQRHLINLQQSVGSDSTDVYSGSVTTGTPRPLFTTTARSRPVLSTTQSPIFSSRPTLRYRTSLQDLEPNTQETTTTETTSANTSPPVPVVQIPPNRPIEEQLVAIRQPYQRGTILVPLSQIQNRIVPYEQTENYGIQYENQQYIRETTPKPITENEPRPIYVRRLPPPQFRPIPVQVDENGFIRDVRPQNERPSPYPLPVPVSVAPTPKYIDDDIDNDVDQISPPVSTRDFQKLLQQLIVRQTRLERISALTDPRRNRQFYRPNPSPVYYIQRSPENRPNGPVQFLPEQRQYPSASQQEIVTRPQVYNSNSDPYTTIPQSHVPNRRVARLLSSNHDSNSNEEYLPPDVREMLLLRMLQLAINPALPLEEDDTIEATTRVSQYKKVPVRNVEILGEESEETTQPVRTKIYRG